MRSDSVGFFWEDVAAVKQKKAPPPKPVPPERIWEKPDYLPNFDKAKLYSPNLMTDDEIVDHMLQGKVLDYDIECYINYAMFGFFCKETDKYILLEKIPDLGIDFDTRKLKWILQNFRFRTFNGRNYDILMSEAALKGFDTKQLKEVSDFIIQKKFDEFGNKIRITPRDTRLKFKLKKLYRNEDRNNKQELDHIDIMEVLPGKANLKTYAARNHTKLMQDLPFHHASILTLEQMTVLRWYHGNDMHHTADLAEHLKEEMQLRDELTKEYGVDVRSKSDAQIAETILAAELERLTGTYPEGAEIPAGTVYKFKPAPWLKFNHPHFQYAFEVVKNIDYVVGIDGKIINPPQLEAMLIPLGDQKFQMGIGGLHSTEKKTAHFARDGFLLADVDVTSFYPFLMLLLDIFPARHPRLKEIFWKIVQTRIAAKKEGNKSKAGSLKIVINGTYGKLSERFSIIYSPDGTINVCLNGQLSLLMLVERFYEAGMTVISANTDGLCVKLKSSDKELFRNIVKQWEAETGLEMEDTWYKMLLSRDVNNYIAIKDENAIGWNGKKQKAGWKGKGAYLNFWHKDNIDHNEQLKHHPVNLVSQEAVIEYLKSGTPIDDYIRACKDVSKFITVRQVNEGAFKNGEYLGKTIRFYHATKDKDPIIVVSNGHKVGNSVGAQPLMEMGKDLPDDIDYDWYIDRSYKMLKEVAYIS